jgi:patatin-like phospholipase/acyl hydrolase
LKSCPTDDGRVAIKDIFQMTAAASMSSMITVGLSIPSPEQATEPAYYSEDLIDLYQVKSADMETMVSHNDHFFLSSLWLTFFTMCAYYYGTLKFDHANIEKAYHILD